MKKYIKSTRGNLVYTIERQEYSETFRTPENYFKHATRAAWYSVNASFNVFVYYKGIYYMAERTDNHGVITTLEFVEISAEQAAAIQAKNVEELMSEAETYERDTVNAAIEYDAESATEYAKQAEFSATVAENYARRAAEYAAEAGTTEAASAADAAAEYAVFARSYADSATETAEQATAEAEQRAAWLEANPEHRAYIEAEAAAHQWSAKETAENVEYWASIITANRAALALLDAYAEAIGEYPEENDPETQAAYRVARDELTNSAARADEHDRETVELMTEAIARSARRPDLSKYKGLEYLEFDEDAEPAPTYQRHELEAFLGEYVDAYDVDAIEAEATEHDPKTGRAVWTLEAVRDLAAIAERHEITA